MKGVVTYNWDSWCGGRAQGAKLLWGVEKRKEDLHIAFFRSLPKHMATCTLQSSWQSLRLIENVEATKVSFKISEAKRQISNCVCCSHFHYCFSPNIRWIKLWTWVENSLFFIFIILKISLTKQINLARKLS